MGAQAKELLYAKVAFCRAAFFVGQEKAKPAVKLGWKTTGLSGAIGTGSREKTGLPWATDGCGFLEMWGNAFAVTLELCVQGEIINNAEDVLGWGSCSGDTPHMKF